MFCLDFAIYPVGCFPSFLFFKSISVHKTVSAIISLNTSPPIFVFPLSEISSMCVRPLAVVTQLLNILYLCSVFFFFSSQFE